MAFNNGILISLSGITGANDGQSNAHSEVLSALVRDKIKILLISRDDILNLTTTDNLVEHLQDKMLKLTIEKTIS